MSRLAALWEPMGGHSDAFEPNLVSEPRYLVCRITRGIDSAGFSATAFSSGGEPTILGAIVLDYSITHKSLRKRMTVGNSG